MSENISNNALIYAILSLNGEIATQHDYLDSGEVPDQDREEEESLLSDLEQALMEFIDVYKSRAKSDKSLPDLDELLTDQL